MGSTVWRTILSFRLTANTVFADGSRRRRFGWCRVCGGAGCAARGSPAPRLRLLGGHLTIRDYHEASAPPRCGPWTPNGDFADLDPGRLPGRDERSAECFPRSPGHRWVPGRCPSSTPPASPRLRRRPSPWPPSPKERHGLGVDPTTSESCTADRPISARLEPA